MGCSQSKLDDEESVQLCKDRKRFIKQAVEQRTRFATGHIAYIESMKRVSAALRDYIEGDEPREFALESVITPPFTPVKKKTKPRIGNGNGNDNGNGFIPISAKSFTPSTIDYGVGENDTLRMNYHRPGGNPAILVEERLPSPETVRIISRMNYHRPGGNPAISVEERPPSPETVRITSGMNYYWPGGNPANSVEERPPPPETVQITSRMNYYWPGGNPANSVQERPPPPETVRIETYSPMQHYGTADGYFTMQSPPTNPSIFPYSPPNIRPNIPPPSPQNAQWDFFWNPFSSLDYYGYPNRSSVDQSGMDDEYRGLRQVREEEGIPDLEEDETEHEDYVVKRNVIEERTRNDMNSSRRNVVEERTRNDISSSRRNVAEERTRNDINSSRKNVAEERTRNDISSSRRNVVEERTRNDVNFSKEQVIVEDVDDDDDEEEEEEEDGEEDEEEGSDDETETEHDARDSQQARDNPSFEVSKNQAAGHMESSHREMAIGKQEDKEEMAGFTVYVNRRPTSMAEVINDLEAQFKTVCNAANDVSVLLESKKAQYLLTSHEHSGLMETCNLLFSYVANLFSCSFDNKLHSKNSYLWLLV